RGLKATAFYQLEAFRRRAPASHPQRCGLRQRMISGMLPRSQEGVCAIGVQGTDQRRKGVRFRSERSSEDSHGILGVDNSGGPAQQGVGVAVAPLADGSEFWRR